MSPAVIVLLLVVVALGGSVLVLVRRVPPGQVAVVERLGELQQVQQPGLHLILFGDRLIRVPTGEETAAVRAVTLTARGGGLVEASATVSIRVTDPRAAVRKAPHRLAATEELVLSTLRDEADARDQEMLLGSAEEVTARVQQVLDQALPAWGLQAGLVDVRLERGGWG